MPNRSLPIFFTSLLLSTSALFASATATAANAVVSDMAFSLYNTAKASDVRAMNLSDEVPTGGSYALSAKPKSDVNKIIFTSSCMAEPLEDAEAPFLMPLPAKSGTCDVKVTSVTTDDTENSPIEMVIKISETKTEDETSTPTAPAASATPAAESTTTATPNTPPAEKDLSGTTSAPLKAGLVKDANGNIMYRIAPDVKSASQSRLDALTQGGRALSPDVFAPEEDRFCQYPANCANDSIPEFRVNEGIDNPAIGALGGGMPTIIAMLRSTFAFTCEVSHFAYYDPIRAPNEFDKSNLNMFFGNTHPEADYSQPNAPTKRSTCNGGTANMSSYWTPALLDADGNPQIPTSITVQYASSNHNIPFASVKPIPSGLKMLTGMPTAMTSLGFEEASFSCGDKRASNVPICEKGRLTMQVQFRQCWDGKNLESDDQSHIVAPDHGACPDTHPTAIPALTYFINYNVKEDTKKWRLSSDRYALGAKNIGGFSLFGGYVDGWNKELLNAWHSNCITKGMKCTNSLGDGRTLDYHTMFVSPLLNTKQPLLTTQPISK